jgi:ketosteroid isomerase-like protein
MTMDLELLAAKVAIQERYSAYCFALDGSDADAFTACFTADGVFDVVGRGAFEGHDAMRALIAGTSEGRPRHMYLNFMVTSVDGDRADSTAYFLLVDKATGENTAYGHYVDELARESDGQWRFRRRTVNFEWTSPTYGARPVHAAQS